MFTPIGYNEMPYTVIGPSMQVFYRSCRRSLSHPGTKWLNDFLKKSSGKGVSMAAARLLQRRLTSFLCQRRSYFPASEESSVCLLRKQFTSLFCQDLSQFSIPQGLTHASQITIGIRGIHTHTKSVDTADDDAENTKNCTDDPKVPANLSEMPNFICSESNVKYTALSNLKTSARHDLAMIFTCRVCETRSVKTVCRESYEKGVVVARCGGCNNFHLIADRLGWFGEPGTVEDLLAARGEEVRRGSVDSLNLTLEDLVGTGAKSS